jgi:hypothetical protein
MTAIVGLERERVLVKGAVQRITRAIFDLPLRRRRAGDRTGLLAPPPLSVFKRLEPMGFGLDEAREGWWIFNPADCTPDVVWPLNVGSIMERNGHDRLMLTRVQTVTTKEVRGAVTRFSPFMVREDIAMRIGDELTTVSAISAWVGGEWTNADAHRRYWNDDIPEVSQESLHDRMQPRLATAVALRQRYEWAVAFALNEDAPSIRFATDPTGIKELYRLRDVPKGRDRRESLIGWVEDHWRQNRHDPDVEVYVRKHLRGAVRLDWRSLVGEVLSSQFDLEKRDALIAEREAMRGAGTDRRARAR